MVDDMERQKDDTLKDAQDKIKVMQGGRRLQDGPPGGGPGAGVSFGASFDLGAATTAYTDPTQFIYE